MSEKIDYSKYNETEQSLEKWLDIIKSSRTPLYNQISKHILPKSTVIEIGAGSAWLSSLLSQNKNIEHVTTIELEKRRLELARVYFSFKLKADQNKISFHHGDFHNLSFISDESIDIIFIDAALHHTNDLSRLLKELYRVLNKNGQIIAIREPVSPSFPILKQFRKYTFGIKQKRNGDIENTYTKKEWGNYFKKYNFHLNFYPLYNNSKKDKVLSKFPINKFNGVLFGRYYMIANKKPYNLQKNATIASWKK